MAGMSMAQITPNAKAHKSDEPAVWL